jgi:tRNA 5-methylaminomethyl-2-thiouridine biosynthesis bifunctional protein
MLTPARLVWGADGTPISDCYDDVYHTTAGGPAQAEQVFMAGNGLPARWQGQQRFVICETGFGLGLNFLATWAAWRADPAACRFLHFVSIEKHPFSATDLKTAHALWPQFADLAAELQAKWPPLLPGTHRLWLDQGRVMLTLVFGDAVEKLRHIEAEVDAFYLDGFSPAKNPDLWSPAVCKALARLAKPGATLATWSVAGSVRQALTEAGFQLEKRPGFGGKRQMLVGINRSRRPLRQVPYSGERSAIVIGAGAAGSSISERLAARGWQVTVLERHAAPGQGASGNIAGVFRPLPSADDNRLARLTRAGYLLGKQHLQTLDTADLGLRYAACGVLHLGRDAEHAETMAHVVARLQAPPDYLQYLDTVAASALVGYPLENGGWWFPQGGWIQPPSLCRANLAHYPEQIQLLTHTPVADIHYQDGHWQALDAQGQLIASAPVLVMASGTEAPNFSPFRWLPQRIGRGQVTHLAESVTPPLQQVVCKQGYVTPAVDGLRIAGASLVVGDSSISLRLDEQLDNLHKLEKILPGFLDNYPESARNTLTGKVGFRPISPDRLPIVGAVPLVTDKLPDNLRLPQLQRQPSLYCLQGFGARGLVWATLMAELLAAQIEGEPLPLESDLVQSLDPGRFLIGRWANLDDPQALSED